jgi:hypothetical protein
MVGSVPFLFCQAAKRDNGQPFLVLVPLGLASVTWDRLDHRDVTRTASQVAEPLKVTQFSCIVHW